MCQTVSAAEVIFVVDESVSSRASDYSRRVRDILQLTIHTFKDAHNGSLGAFRFAVVKYSSDPSIAFNLGQYDEPAPMLSHVERINYEGRLSNINKALALARREVTVSSKKEDCFYGAFNDGKQPLIIRFCQECVLESLR